MARTGTPLSFLYQREIKPIELVRFERSDFEQQQENSGKQDEEEDGIKKYDSPSDNGDNPSLKQEAEFHLGRGSRFVRSILLNSRIVFSCFVFIFHVMKLWDCHHLCFYALVDIVIHFFDTDLSVLIRLSVIEV